MSLSLRLGMKRTSHTLPFSLDGKSDEEIRQILDNVVRTSSLDEIAAIAELPRRIVRYYIQTGLIDRPEGVGKGAFYTERHVEQLLQIRKWQLAGLSLERIGEVLRRQNVEALPPAPRRSRGHRRADVSQYGTGEHRGGLHLPASPGRRAPGFRSSLR